MVKLPLLLFAPVIALAQTPFPVPQTTPKISAWYQMPDMKAPLYRWTHIEPPLVGTVDAFGDLHLGVTSLIGVGPGILTLFDPATGMTTFSVDNAYVPFRASVEPTLGSKCDSTGGWYGSQQYFYYCAPDGTGNGFVWARAAAEARPVADAHIIQGCTIDQAGNMLCADKAIPTPDPKPEIAVADEAPVHSADATERWTLAHIPDKAGTECRRNDTVQRPGVDYTNSGAWLITPFWTDQDVIRCSYSYQ